MAETSNIQLLPAEELDRRIDDGLMAPMERDASGHIDYSRIEIVDCGDVRPLTTEAAQNRLRIHDKIVIPARFYGAGQGLALMALITMGAQDGEAALRGFLNEFNAESFVEVAADMSDAASSLYGLAINTHSDVSHEASTTAITHDHPQPDTPLGCKLAALAGQVVNLSHESLAVDEAHEINSLAGIETPVNLIKDGARLFGELFTADFAVTRQAFSSAYLAGDKHMPTVILQDSVPESLRIGSVMDLRGLRSDAEAHVRAALPRFHHTPEMSQIVPNLHDGFRHLDPDLLAAAGILVGTMTRLTLSGRATPHALRTELIAA